MTPFLFSHIRTLVLGAVIVWLAAVAVYAQQPAQGLIQHSVSPDPVVVTTADGSKHQFTVELAVTEREQQQGLMFRESLDDDKGMLFPYQRADFRSFWMRNTLIPLDIIYIKRGGRIANIITAEPQTDTSRPSKGRVIAVLELRGGLAGELGIAPGDVVQHPLIVGSVQ